MRNLFVVVMLAAAIYVDGVDAALVIKLDASDNATVLNGSTNPAVHGEQVITSVDTVGTNQNAVAQSGTVWYDTLGGPHVQPVLDFSGANLVAGVTTARTVVLVHRWDNTAGG